MVHAEPLRLLPVVVGGGLALLLWNLLPLVLGASPGQRLLRLRLVDASGHKPSFFRMLVRAFVSAVSTAFFFAGPAWGLLVDGKRRGLHDVIAGTVVVQK